MSEALAEEEVLSEELLIQFVYTSAAVRDMNDEDLQSLLAQSRANNQRDGITGMLLYSSGCFFQVLEGPESAISNVYDRIERDARHTDIMPILTTPIDQRDFGDWSMGYPNVTEKDLSTIDGLNNFFSDGVTYRDMDAGRTKLLLNAFRQGMWRVKIA